MTHKPGDIIGIPFPYTDLTTRKRRPVLVLKRPDRRGDFLGLAVTSVLTKEFAVVIDEKSMAVGRLPKKSWVRYDKIFTLNDSIILKNYGSLSQDVFGEIITQLCNHLGCIELTDE